MTKLSENDNQPNTLPSNILDDSEVLTAKYKTRVSTTNYDHNEYLVLDEDLNGNSCINPIQCRGLFKINLYTCFKL